MKQSARDRTTSSSSSVASSNASGNSSSVGIQLLSPTLQQSIEAKRSGVVKPLTASRIGGSTNTPTSNNFSSTRVTTAKGAAFDFDSFTLESVRVTASLHKPRAHSNSTNKSDSEADGLSSHAQKLAAAMDAQPSQSDFSSSFHTMRSTEDFDALENRRHRNPSSASSGISSTGAVSAVVGAPAIAFKRVTPAGELAASRKKTTVLMSGWLQKRKGLVLKRWKAYYCLLRDDDHLCLYASEDTINGRVEQRFQLLRVLLTEKSDSAFHVIGVGSDGAPRKEEFRALHSVDWANWFRRGFRDYLDNVSLQGVLARKPELLQPESPSASRSEDSYDDEAGSDNQLTHDRRRVRSSQQQRQYAERQSIGSRQQPQKNPQMRHESYDNFSETTRSTLSAFSGVSSWTSQSVSDGDATRNSKSAEEEASEVSDCPMIDVRDWQGMPILESARGSESTTSLRSSDVVKPSSAFSW
ncbi:hypothetical protein Gpo141_00009431 [Globisporangium polare]